METALKVCIVYFLLLCFTFGEYYKMYSKNTYQCHEITKWSLIYQLINIICVNLPWNRPTPQNNKGYFVKHDQIYKSKIIDIKYNIDSIKKTSII